MRATTATALGAAAAHAKLLAIQEDREIERLVSTVINTQVSSFFLIMHLIQFSSIIACSVCTYADGTGRVRVR